MEKLFCQPFMLGARVLRRKSMSAAEKIFCVKAANVVQSTHPHSVFEKTIKFQSHSFPLCEFSALLPDYNENIA